MCCALDGVKSSGCCIIVILILVCSCVYSVFQQIIKELCKWTFNSSFNLCVKLCLYFINGGFIKVSWFNPELKYIFWYSSIVDILSKLAIIYIVSMKEFSYFISWHFCYNFYSFLPTIHILKLFSSAKIFAIAKPIPSDPPVTIAQDLPFYSWSKLFSGLTF